METASGGLDTMSESLHACLYTSVTVVTLVLKASHSSPQIIVGGFSYKISGDPHMNKFLYKSELSSPSLLK